MFFFVSQWTPKLQITLHYIHCDILISNLPLFLVAVFGRVFGKLFRSVEWFGSVNKPVIKITKMRFSSLLSGVLLKMEYVGRDF